MPTLEKYNRKRKFQETPEPKGRLRKNERPIFVVQRHAARRLHFDLRLQINGALASWAVPKGPPQEVGEKRLAVHVEDHPIEYAKFEGDIPKGNYGAGHVDIWDQGTFELEGNESAAEQVERGDLKLRLRGERLNGRYVLVKMRNSSRGNEWLFIRKSDPLEVHGDADAKQNRPEKAASLLAQTIPDLAGLNGSKNAPMPEHVSVALAQLSEKPFSDPNWLFEIKWDGERSLAYVRDGHTELRARSNRNITPEYPELKSIVKQLNARQAIVDGENVVLDEDGRSDFTSRHNHCNKNTRQLFTHTICSIAMVTICATSRSRRGKICCANCFGPRTPFAIPTMCWRLASSSMKSPGSAIWKELSPSGATVVMWEGVPHCG